MMDRQTDEQTDANTDKETDRQTETEGRQEQGILTHKLHHISFQVDSTKCVNLYSYTTFT